MQNGVSTAQPARNNGGDMTGTIIAVIAILAVAGCAAYAWKKGLLSDLRR